jgi:hypothetical protein
MSVHRPSVYPHGTELYTPKNLAIIGQRDIIEKKILQWYGHVKRMPEERRKRGRARKTRMEGVQAAMTTRNLEPDQWRKSEEWCLVSGRRRQLLKNRIDRSDKYRTLLMDRRTSSSTRSNIFMVSTVKGPIHPKGPHTP